MKPSKSRETDARPLSKLKRDNLKGDKSDSRIRQPPPLKRRLNKSRLDAKDEELSALESAIPRNYFANPALRDIKNIEDIVRAHSNYKSGHQVPATKKPKDGENRIRSPFINLPNRSKVLRTSEDRNNSKYDKLPRILLADRRRERRARDYSVNNSYHEASKRREQSYQPRNYPYLQPDWWG